MANFKELKAALNVTSSLKLAKVDKDILSDLIANHIAIHNAVKSIEDDFETARKGFMKGIEDKFDEYNRLAGKLNVCDRVEQREILDKLDREYPEVEQAAKSIKDYREAIENKDYTVSIKPVNRAKYLECLKEAKPEYTASDIVDVNLILSE